MTEGEKVRYRGFLPLISTWEGPYDLGSTLQKRYRGGGCPCVKASPRSHLFLDRLKQEFMAHNWDESWGPREALRPNRTFFKSF
jgi:hypothetical protein